MTTSREGPPILPRRTHKSMPPPNAQRPAGDATKRNNEETRSSQDDEPGPSFAGTFASSGQETVLSVPLENATKAVQTVREAMTYFSPGKTWIKLAPTGEVEIKGAILYKGTVIATMEFSPLDGQVLPKGYRIPAEDAQISLNVIKQYLRDIVPALLIVAGAEFRDPDKYWIIPLVYANKIVAHIKVYYDGVHIVPDYPADQEMAAL